MVAKRPLRIAVYGIAKNEEAFAARWAQSAQGADEIFVLDTGSSDKTVEILQAHGVRVAVEDIRPWRFDMARNRALSHLPQDIDVAISLDLDEILLPGWREAIEKVWQDDTTFLRYPFISDWTPEGQPNIVSWGHKIHHRHKYEWKYAVHEILRPQAEHKEVFTEELRIEHRPSPQKSNLLFYHNLLLKEFAENPQEPRYAQYLARSFFDQKNYSKALEYCETFLDFPSKITGNQERSFTYRMAAWSLQCDSEIPLEVKTDQIIAFLWKAVAESPHDREAWLHLAEEMIRINNLPNAWVATLNAIHLGRSEESFRLEPKAWSEYPYILLEQLSSQLSAMGLSSFHRRS